MEKCKFCESVNIRKEGFSRGVQRYKCNDCGRVQVNRDFRIKFDSREKNAALTLYLEGNGFRRIARILSKIFNKKFVYQTVIQWIKNFGYSLENQQISSQQESKDIEVLEMDELYTYIQKNGIKSGYGLLLTEIGCVLIHLKSDPGMKKL